MTYYQFAADNGEPYGSLECFYMTAEDVRAHWTLRPADDPEDMEPGDDPRPAAYGVPSEFPGGPDDCVYGAQELAGWYWVAGFPGCAWDGDPMGPFATEAEALADAGVYVEEGES